MPEDERDQELRARVQEDPELTRAAMRLGELFSEADMPRVLAAVESGDVERLARELHASLSELEQLVVAFRQSGERLREAFGPELERYAARDKP